MAGIVLQYNVLYCSRRQGCLCHKTGSCVAIQQGLGSKRAGPAGALGPRLGEQAALAWGARQLAAGARAWHGRAGAHGRRATACWSARGAQAAATRRRGAQRACGARGSRRGSRRGRLPAADAAGARGARGLGAGGAGWLGAVHSMHSACFWPGSTWYFS